MEETEDLVQEIRGYGRGSQPAIPAWRRQYNGQNYGGVPWKTEGVEERLGPRQSGVAADGECF